MTDLVDSIFWDLYIAVVYAILYLCFVAYPIVFSEIRGWAPGVTGKQHQVISDEYARFVCISVCSFAWFNVQLLVADYSSQDSRTLVSALEASSSWSANH